MKKIGKYYRNPAPFALAAVNPAKKKKRRKNPFNVISNHRFRESVKHIAKIRDPEARAAAFRKLGASVRRKKNPAATVARKVGTKRWHHKRGRFLYNPAKKIRLKLRRRRRKNPLDIQHVIVQTPTRNPARRKPSRRKKSSLKKITPMSKHRKRRSKRTRNPVRRSTRRRSSRRRRNPSRRSFLRRMRNPVVISDVIDKTNIKRGIGILGGIAGTRYLVNKLIQGDAVTGQRMFDLPGVTYSTATAPLTQAQFAEKNRIALALYETLIPAVAGYFARRYDNAISEGLLGAAVANAGIAMLRTTQVGQVAGLGAFLPRQRGIETYIPGVPPMLSGPATGFINNGSPVRRAGMGAVVNRRWNDQTTMAGPDPFKAN